MLGVREVCRCEPRIVADIAHACSSVKVYRRVVIQCDINEAGPVAVHSTNDIDCTACPRFERQISVLRLIRSSE